MLYICDRSTPDLNKDDELNWISQAAYSPGRSTTELVFTFKIVAEKAICVENFTLYLLMLDMSRVFDSIDRGILLKGLSGILESDE